MSFTTTSPAQPAQAPAEGQCRGYILAHQHPSFASSPTSAVADPYTVLPCPFLALSPAQLSSHCAPRSPSCAPSSPVPKSPTEKENIFHKKMKGGCAKARWCERHWCGGCKRVNGLGKAVHGLGESHGAIRPAQGGNRGQDQTQKEGNEEEVGALQVDVQEAAGVRPDTPIPSAAHCDGKDVTKDIDVDEADGKTIDATLDCQMHLLKQRQGTEPTHDIDVPMQSCLVLQRERDMGMHQ